MRIPDSIDRTDSEALADWLESDAFDPESGEWRDATALRAIVTAEADVETAKQRLATMVTAARGAGFSWGAIGTVLGISRQAARQRFGTPAHM